MIENAKLSKLEGVVPSKVYAQLQGVVNKKNLTTTLRLAHFLAQTAHESAGFLKVRENMNYSDVHRIATIFKKDIDTNHDHAISASELDHAKKYVHNPIALANAVYANQNGNGNEASGDGYNYRAAGYIGLTGRSNFKAFSDYVGEDCVANPELVATKYPLESAIWFFDVHDLWGLCDEGATDLVIRGLTHRINGGLNGLEDRTRLFNNVYWKTLK